MRVRTLIISVVSGTTADVTYARHRQRWRQRRRIPKGAIKASGLSENDG